MKDLEPEDLLKYGLIPEFIGRLPGSNFGWSWWKSWLVPLGQKSYLTKQYQELFKLDGAKPFLKTMLWKK